MLNKASTIPPREIVKWYTYAIVLMAPGSFVVLPLLWLAQHWVSRTARLTAVRTGGHSCAPGTSEVRG